MRYLRKVALLAALYFITGQLGLMLAVPPGYATMIWPPSGLAMGMLIMHGPRLWPGIFIGAFLLDALHGGALSFGGADMAKLIASLCIAYGSTLQAFAGRRLAEQYLGLPLRLNRMNELFKLFLLTGPVACLMSTSVGVTALTVLGLLQPHEVMHNWCVWYVGDLFGVIVFLPLMLVMPGNPNRLTWRGLDVSGLPMVAMLSVLVPLGLTFYAWQITAENVHQQAQAQFEMLAEESEQALLHRLDSYNDALLGGAGFFLGSDYVSRHEWQTYVDAIRVRESFPGVSGLGYIVALKPQQLDGFVAQAHREGAPNYAIHPSGAAPYYIIKYIEPVRFNAQGLGLNIAYDGARREAAEQARDSGLTTMSRRVTLLQDTDHGPGFLLLHPLYQLDKPHNNVEERRDAFLGWVYVPFIAQSFMHNLTDSQGESLQMRIYDGLAAKPEALIYDSREVKDMRGASPAFTVTKQLDLMQRHWLVTWTSTPAFEQEEESESPLLILIGGVLFSGLFGLLLLVVTIRRTETMQWMAEDRKFIFPLAIFALSAIGSHQLYHTLRAREVDYARNIVQEEARKIEQLVAFQTRDKLLALQRMAGRWELAGGTPYAQWVGDAHNYTEQLEGLKALEWVDSTYHVRWAEPMKGNEKAIGLDVRFDAEREKALRGAAERGGLTITEPLDLVQGYRAFLAYAPVRIDGKFDGFVVGIFTPEDFLGNAIAREANGRYAIYLEHDGKEFFHSAPNSVLMPGWGLQSNIRIQDKDWVVRVVPTQALVQSEMTSLPVIMLSAGLVIGLLVALTARSILLARIRSHYLAESNRLNVAVLSSTGYMVVATNPEGIIIVYNPAAEAALGYPKRDVLNQMTPLAFYDPVEVAHRAAVLSHTLNTTIAPGVAVFTTLPLREGQETREWNLVTKDGDHFPVSATVTTLRNRGGAVTGFLWVVEDITERREQQQALQTSEQTFRSAMEHASIGMALVDLSGHWRKVNPALCDLFGYTEQQLLALDFQAVTHPEDLERDLAYVRQALAGTISTYQMEKRYFHKSGRVIWALLSVSLVRDAQGIPQYFISQVQDITEQKEMERIKSEFISIVSHELRTPLTSIRGSLGLMAGSLRDELGDKAKRLVDIAFKNSERLILLINDILDMDKIASGKMRFEMQAEPLAPLVQQAVEANLAYAEKFNVTFQLLPVNPDFTIQVDASRFTQVLTNFLSNAAKFSPTNGTVEIGAQRLGPHVRITVADHGPGISAEFRPRIFGKFSQADSSATRSKGGTGLGLHISKQMVEHMGGQIGFDSSVGRGSSFWMQFPLLNPGNDLLPYNLPTLEPGLPHILHVEDDLDLYHMLAAGLQGKAVLVHAPSLTQARRILQEANFALVVLDLGMPDGSGLELLDAVNGTPVMVLSTTELGPEVAGRVAASLVKARVSEHSIIETILALVGKEHA